MTRDVINSIIDQSDIVVVIGNDIPLEPLNGKYRGKCPFHEEKQPSFFVYPNTQRFYCFSCQKSGNVIDYLRLTKGLSFKEALNHLKPDISAQKEGEAPSKPAFPINKGRIDSLISDLRENIDRLHPSTLMERVKEIDRVKISTESDMDIIADLYHLRSNIMYLIDADRVHDTDYKPSS